MKVREAIERARALAGITADEKEMIGWLSDCDGRVVAEVLCQYGDTDFAGYGEGDTNRELLANDPYSVLYVYYLAAQIYLSFADMERYNNFIGLYADAMMDFGDKYAASHTAKPLPQIYI